MGGKFTKQSSKSCMLELIIMKTLKRLCSFHKIINRIMNNGMNEGTRVNR